MHYSLRGSGRDIIVQAESSAEAHRVVIQIIPGATVTGARRARFDTYCKVQWWDARSCAWHDIQKQHPTAAEAEAAYPVGKRCRTVEVTPTGRRPLR